MPETTTPAPTQDTNARPAVPTLDLPLQYEYDGKTYGPGGGVPVDDPIAFAQLRRAAIADTLRIRLAEEARQRAEQAKADQEKAAQGQAASQVGSAENQAGTTEDRAGTAAPVIAGTPPTDTASADGPEENKTSDAGTGTPDTDKSETDKSENSGAETDDNATKDQA